MPKKYLRRNKCTAGQGASLILAIEKQKIAVKSICDRYTHRQTQTERHMYR